MNPAMALTILQSWLLLFYFDFTMHFFGFQRVHKLVQRSPQAKARNDQPTKADLSHGVDLACVFYFKPALCLQRSAALTVLMRKNGWEAEMVIGAQLMPFLSHAWVEVEGNVVNDKSYIAQMFQVLERC